MRQRRLLPRHTAPVRLMAQTGWLAEARFLGGLYVRLIGIQVRATMQYKVSFLLRTAGSLGFMLLEFAVIVVLFQRFPHLAGWSLAEVALLYGISATAFGLSELLCGALDTGLFAEMIVRGDFDRILTRPVSALLQVVAGEFSLRRLGRIAQGVGVLVLAGGMLPGVWSVGKVMFLALTLLSGTAIFMAVWLLGASYCFWTVRATEAVNVFTYGGTTLASYPLDVFDRWARQFALFILPLAWVSYVPALYLLDRADRSGLPTWLPALTPVAAVIALAVAGLVWSVGVRHYQSTGS